MYEVIDRLEKTITRGQRGQLKNKSNVLIQRHKGIDL